MAYTVKQVATLSGVSVRALHFYDASGLLKPAYLGANGYRYYEEPQLLQLQQILFYRELGFALKEVGRIVNRRGFEKVRALQSHRAVLQRKLADPDRDHRSDRGASERKKAYEKRGIVRRVSRCGRRGAIRRPDSTPR